MFSEEENKTIAPTDDEKLVKEILQRIKEGKAHYSSWRNDAKENYDFFSGRQWSSEDIEVLKEQNRPAVVFNRVARTINAIIGLEINNRQAVSYIPRQQEDSGVNDLLNDAARWVRDGCDAEDEESESFFDVLICGHGFTQTVMNYEEEVEGVIEVNRLDPLKVIPDYASKKRNFDDGRWIAFVDTLTKEEILEKYKDKDLTAEDIFGLEDTTTIDGTQIDYPSQDDESDDINDQDKPKKTYDVIYYQWYDLKEVYAIDDGQGNITTLEKKKFELWKSLNAQQGIEVKSVKAKKRFYYQAEVVGKKLVDKTELDCGAFTIRGITGLRDRNKNYWFGIVSLMKDPQRWANKWLSQVQHILNSNAKGGLLIEKGAVVNPNKLREDWAKADGIVELNPGALAGGKIQQKQAPAYPDGIDRLLQYAVGSINDVTGVNVELLGLTNKDQSGVLERERKESGVNILAAFFDALRRYRKEQGRVMAYFIIHYISDGRLIRIVGEDGAKYIPLLKDQLTMKYDVVIDDAPVTHDQKRDVFEKLMALIPIAQQAGAPIPAEILDYAPLPAALVNKWKEKINKPNPIQEATQQIEIEGAQLENKKTESEVMLNMAKAQNENQNAESQAQAVMQKAVVDRQAKEMKMNMDAAMMQQKMQHNDQNFMMQQQQKNLAFGMDQRRKAIATAATSRNNNQQ